MIYDICDIYIYIYIYIYHTYIIYVYIYIYIYIYIPDSYLIIIIIIITLLSNHRVEIHFALWRLHKNTIFKSHSNACIQ